MKTALAVLIVVAALLTLGCGVDEGVGVSRSAVTSDCTNGDCPPPPPDCTNGDCPPPPPDCTNGDCPPPPPDCTNGDCPPPEPLGCCCVGDNQPGDIRVCCCRNATLDEMTCRQSLVLETGYPDNWHQLIAEATMEGKRPKACNILLKKFCDPPIEEVCTKQKGKKICKKVVKAVCKMLDKLCEFKYCSPKWFPFDEPAPDKLGCEWWNQIHHCKLRTKTK